MKICKGCNIEKDFDEFYKLSANKDGLTGKCKNCIKAQVKDNKEKNADYYREYERKRALLPHRVAARKAYAKTDSGKRASLKANSKYRNSNPKKYKAHNMVNNAIRDKKLFKEPCEVCGSKENIHAHHDDYAKPLNVRWLCAFHHSEWHRENGEASNPF